MSEKEKEKINLEEYVVKVESLLDTDIIVGFRKSQIQDLIKSCGKISSKGIIVAEIPNVPTNTDTGTENTTVKFVLRMDNPKAKKGFKKGTSSSSKSLL